MISLHVSAPSTISNNLPRRCYDKNMTNIDKTICHDDVMTKIKLLF